MPEEGLPHDRRHGTSAPDALLVVEQGDTLGTAHEDRGIAQQAQRCGSGSCAHATPDAVAEVVPAGKEAEGVVFEQGTHSAGDLREKRGKRHAETVPPECDGFQGGAQDGGLC